MGDSFLEIFDELIEDDEDLFSIFDRLEGVGADDMLNMSASTLLSSCHDANLKHQTELETVVAPKSKRLRLSCNNSNNIGNNSDDQEAANRTDGKQTRMSHITVERNRRKQMNDHLSVLRSLMPSFYVKRGDQASIIGGVVDYINELQQVLQSLEAKKQRKAYSEVLSPRVPVSSPRLPSPLSPRKPANNILSPRLNLRPLSPRTPQPTSPYNDRPLNLQQSAGNYNLSPTASVVNSSSLEPSPSPSSTASNIIVNDHNYANEFVANSKSDRAEVEVKFTGPNVVLKTVSPRIPGLAMKIVSTIEDLSLEILHVDINTAEETMLNSFTIKVGIECQLSAEELAQLIQQTLC